MSKLNILKFFQKVLLFFAQFIFFGKKVFFKNSILSINSIIGVESAKKAQYFSLKRVQVRFN
jgi:hypothetical protein